MMKLSARLFLLSGLSLLAFGSQAQEETIVILPDEAADAARDVTADIVLPEDAIEGLQIAEANRGDAAEIAAENAAEAAENALEALTAAQENAADAAQDGLQTAIDAVEGARGDLGRDNIPDDLPDGVPTDIPALPDDLPGDVDLPDLPDVPAPVGD